MDKKTTAIIAVVAVVVIVAAVAFVMMNNNGSKDYNAQEVAKNFVDDYDGIFGDFEIATGGTANLATLSHESICLLKSGEPQKNDDGSNKTRTSQIKIIHFETKDEAAAEFDKYISVGDSPYESKNGSKGATILSQVNPVGMAKNYCTVLNGTKNIKVTAEGATVKEVKASDYGADQIYILYGSFTSDSSAQFTLAVGVIQDGKNLIIFNQTSNTGFGLYYNNAIMESTSAVGIVYITQDDFEGALKTFIKAF